MKKVKLVEAKNQCFFLKKIQADWPGSEENIWKKVNFSLRVNCSTTCTHKFYCTIFPFFRPLCTMWLLTVMYAKNLIKFFWCIFMKFLAELSNYTLSVVFHMYQLCLSTMVNIMQFKFFRKKSMFSQPQFLECKNDLYLNIYR